MAVLTEGRTALPTGTWALDPVHSTIGFEVPYMAGAFRGHFTDADARLTPESLTGAARVAGVEVKDENLAAHLQSPEFFDAQQHPELRFASRSIKRSADELRVDGEITIRGTTKPVELAGKIAGPITDGHGNERINVTLETRVDRTDFGVNWNMPLPNGQQALQNEVRLVAELYFVQGA